LEQPLCDAAKLDVKMKGNHLALELLPDRHRFYGADTDRGPTDAAVSLSTSRFPEDEFTLSAYSYRLDGAPLVALIAAQ
jgi:hypothetical protein